MQQKIVKNPIFLDHSLLLRGSTNSLVHIGLSIKGQLPLVTRLGRSVVQISQKDTKMSIVNYSYLNIKILSIICSRKIIQFKCFECDFTCRVPGWGNTTTSTVSVRTTTPRLPSDVTHVSRDWSVKIALSSKNTNYLGKFILVMIRITVFEVLDIDNLISKLKLRMN